MKTATHKLSMKSFLMFSINYIIGFGFIQTINKTLDLGLWGSLVIALAAFISFTVALVYVKGVANFEGYGGSFEYAKKAHKRKFAFFQGWNQYVQSPIGGAAAPMFLYSVLNDIDPGNEVIYRVLSFTIFVLLILVALFGIKISSRFVLVSAAIKWTLLFLTICTAVYLIFSNNQFGSHMQVSTISTSAFVGALMSFFYAFGGIGGVAAMTADVKNPKKNTVKVIAYTFIFATVFYLASYFIIMGAVQNSPSNAFKQILLVSFGTTGIVLFLIAMIVNKSSSTVSAAIINARSLAPMAQEKMLPEWFGKTNKKGEFGNAMIFDALLKIILMFFIVLLPIWTGTSLSFTDLIDIWTICVFVQYFFTFISIYTLSRQGMFELKMWEKTTYLIGATLMVVALAIYLVPPIVGDAYGLAINTDNSYIVRLIQMSVYATSMMIGFALYFYRKNYEGENSEYSVNA